MHQNHRFSARVNAWLVPIVAVLSLLLAACNKGGNGSGY
jgi:hypothetical protein